MLEGHGDGDGRLLFLGVNTAGDLTEKRGGVGERRGRE